jgi:glycine dehydrogenase subunit 1
VYNLQLDIRVVPHADGKPDYAGLMAAVDGETAAVVVQSPNFFGVVSDFSEVFAAAKAKGAVGVISTYPLLQSVLKTPGAMGAGIATADGQSLGLPLSFGGPYLGIMTCRKEYIRQMPGRIAGRTTDKDGRTGYVLTLQAREQHIRRQKATSNICSNQALCALRALATVCLRGPEGLRRQAALSIERAHDLAAKLCSISGVRMLSDAPFGNEFAVLLPEPAEAVIQNLLNWKYVPGFNLGRYYPELKNGLLVACTEKHTQEQTDLLVDLVRSLL